MTTKKISTKKITISAVMAILAAAGWGGYTIIKEKDLAALRSGEIAMYKVTRVIDGDTFEIEDGDVVRMLGIDAPEEGECYFAESKTALKKLIEGKDVELRTDVTKTDDFGRLLRYTILPSSTPHNVLVDEEMVNWGFAELNDNSRDKLYYGLLLEAREQAIKAKRGMWGACEFTLSEHSQADAQPKSASCNIKGNISTGAFGKTYFLPACNNYSQVKIDPDRGEEYFCSESAAVAAGYQKSTYCP